jgi:flavodoxin
MEFSKVTVIYFSPTGNSKKYACEIAKRFHGEYNELNLTEYDSRRKNTTLRVMN